MQVGLAVLGAVVVDFDEVSVKLDSGDELLLPNHPFADRRLRAAIFV